MTASRKALFVVAGGAAIAIAAAPASASASTTLGSTALASACPGGGTVTYVQRVSPPSASYAAAGAGVLTSWSYFRGSVPATTIKLRVLRPTSTADTFTTVGVTQPQSPAANQVSTYPTRIAVQPGDFLGYTATSAGNFSCGGGAAGFGINSAPGDPADGSTIAYTAIGTPFQLDISAVLEADADGDGYGDETQDLCPTDATTQGACQDHSAPDTTIDKRPKAKTRKRRVTLGFSSPEPGASFECSLDGSGFAACISPLIRTVSKGKHSFQVRALDAAGNRDQTPAIATWKVKKRKRRGGKGE